MDKIKRKEKEFIARKQEILEEAEKIFASKGFHNTAVAEIAHASGFAIGTLYQFFESKEKLYETMVTEKLDVMYAEIRSAVKDADTAIASVEALVRSHFNFVEKNTDFCYLFIRGESTTLSDANAALRDRMIKNYLNHLSFVEGFMREGIKDKKLKAEDPRAMAAALIGIVRSFIFNWMLSDRNVSLISQTDQVVNIFFDGVIKK
jgi:AcrR family transcriptional regulator